MERNRVRMSWSQRGLMTGVKEKKRFLEQWQMDGTLRSGRAVLTLPLTAT